MFAKNPFQYKYVILVASFCYMMITASIIYCIGIYYVSWMDEFNVGSGFTSWIGAVHIGSFRFVAPLSSFLTEKLGYRKTCLIAAALSTIGIVGSSFATDVYTVFVLYGILCGSGFGIGLLPASTAVAFYFKKRGRVLAIGLVTSGSGVGAFIMPYITNVTIATYGWRGAVLISGGLSMNLFVVGALIRSPPNWKRASVSSSPCSGKTFCAPSFRSIGFILLLIHHSLAATGISIVYIHISAVTEYLTGVSRDASNLSLSAIGLANLAGRVFTSVVGHCRGVDPLIMFYCFSALVGITATILPLLSSYPMVIVWAVCFGFFLAPNISLSQVVILYFVDIKDVNAAFAYVMLFQAFGYVSGAPIAGVLYDLTGDYGWSFFFGGGCTLLGVLVFAWPVIDHCRQRKEHIVERFEEAEKKKQRLVLGSTVLGGSHVFIPDEMDTTEPMMNGERTREARSLGSLHLI